ncbi:MAG: asparagine synthase [Bacillota bacterium]|nr:asparagine synthase [Bacillota bacterium]
MREGLLPVIIGSAVTASGIAFRCMDMKKRGMTKHDAKVALGAGLVGLGAAHIILGAIDLFEEK